VEHDSAPWRSGQDLPERVLEREVEAALARPEVERAVSASHVTREVLVAAVRGAGADVLAAAAQAERQYRAERPGPYVWSWAKHPVRRWVAIVGPLSVVGSIAWLVVVVVSGRPETTPLLAVIATAVVVFVAYLPLLEDPRAPRRADVARAALAEWERRVLLDGVLPVLYSKLNEVAPPAYSTALTVREVSPLVRADPLRLYVPTPAGTALAGLVDRLDGGSFAVAGPRGAGKTSLLRAFCGGRYRDPDRAPDLAVLVSAPVDYVAHEFVVHLFAEVCEAVVEHFRGDRRRRRKVRPHPLVSAAHDHLKTLNYVRTYADEVSGKGGFKGFELAGKRAVTMAGRALTYPEVVKRFRVFLRRIAAELATGREVKPGRVIIGIDELDRIGAGEPARRLLNEVKAVFDVQGCYYLVSVSTEAQHDFELSGIGLRSVFDSSFDEVIRVEYLDFEYARRLLRRYVLDLSEQFHALAYVFSGGLARQLVRTARSIVELGRDQPGRDIADVVRALTTAELTRACQATADALTAADDRDGVTDLLRLLEERPATDLKTYGDTIRTAYTGRSERVRQLRDAVAARVHFLATVTDTFTAELTEARMAALDFDDLARARRYAGTNPDAGLSLLRDLDRRWSE
jgi:hypothetical protein